MTEHYDQREDAFKAGLFAKSRQVCKPLHCSLIELMVTLEKMKCCGNCLYYKSYVGQDQCIEDESKPWIEVQGDKKACEKWEFGL